MRNPFDQINSVMYRKKAWRIILKRTEKYKDEISIGKKGKDFKLN